MNRITIDDALKTQLFGNTEPMELCDSNGSPLGHFVPIVPVGRDDNCPYEEEDLKRMRAEQGGRTWDEIKKSLGSE